jgi:hypothetical protein
MDALKALLARCDRGVLLQVNQHRYYGETAQEWLDFIESAPRPPDISDDVRAGILRAGDVVELKVYSGGARSLHHVLHYDLDEAIRLTMESLDAQGVPAQAPSA